MTESNPTAPSILREPPVQAYVPPKEPVVPEISAEDAIKGLIIKKSIPPQAKKRFGSLNVKELYDVVNDPDLLLIDSMVYRKEISQSEAFKYILVLPEYDILRRKIDQLAKNTVRHLVATGAIRAAIQKGVPSVQIKRLNQPVKPGKALGEILISLSEFIGSQAVQGVNFRNFRIGELHERAIEYFSLEVIKELSKKEYTDLDRQEISTHFFEHWDQVRLSREGYNFPGKVVLDSQQHFKEIVGKYNDQFRSFINTHKESFSKPPTGKELTDEIDLMFDDISRLSHTKRIGIKRKVMGEASMDIEAGNFVRSSSFAQSAICIVRLHLDLKGTYTKPTLVSTPNGDSSVIHAASPSSVEFYLDRSTGELNYALTFVPVSEALSKQDYLLLKHAALSFLLDYLEGRLTAVKAIKNETADAVATVASGMPQTSTNQKPKIEEESDDDEDDESETKESPNSNEATDPKDSNWRKAWRKCRERIKGKSGNLVLAAIKRVLGKEPIRVVGSHFVFEGKNGQRCPLSIHGTQTVDLGVLRNFLVTLEIPPATLTAEV